jgi:type I restriction enzyme R subunit
VFNEEVEAFCAVYFKPTRKESVHDHAEMNGILDKAVERFKARDAKERDELKALLINFPQPLRLSVAGHSLPGQ